MQIAINLSTFGLGFTADNPTVGAIIVKSINQTDKIIGSGATAVGGRPHAEVLAIENAHKNGFSSEDLRGSTLYVTLEPCSHYGKTPPCTRSIIEAGFSKVVVALKDPDIRVAGRGIEQLREAGIAVELGVLAKQAYSVLFGYFTNRLYNRSSLWLKLAVSQDQVIGEEGNSRLIITNDISRNICQTIRLCCDAVMVGINTVLADNPSLNYRLQIPPPKILRSLVLDTNLRIAECGELNLLKNSNVQPLYVICSKNSDKDKQDYLKGKSIQLILIDENSEGRLDITNILEKTYVLGFRSILLEGGAEIAKSFLKTDCVDRISLFKSSTMLKNSKSICFDEKIDFNRYYLVNELNYNGDMLTDYVRKCSCLLES